MHRFPAILFSMLLVVSSAAVAQRTTVPIIDFKGIAVSSPGVAAPTAEQVKQAILAAALSQDWDATVQADGSIAASATKDTDHFLAVRVTYDATQYSVAFVDSKGLRHSPGAPPITGSPAYAQLYADAEAKQAARFSTLPESAFAVKTPGYIHPAYEAWVREFIAGIRRRLRALG